MDKLKPCPLLVYDEYIASPDCGSEKDPIAVDRNRLTAIAAELTDNPDPEVVVIGIELGVWLQGSP